MSAPTTVLVVEDEEGFIEALTSGLAREGFRVQVARDGAQALAMFPAVEPDLVLLDVMLPKRSGFDVLKQIRADVDMHSLPVLILTAKGQQQDRRIAEDLGADAFVTKPYSNAEVVSVVRGILGQNAGQA